MERALHAYDVSVIERKLERPYVLNAPDIAPGRKSILMRETYDGF